MVTVTLSMATDLPMLITRPTPLRSLPKSAVGYHWVVQKLDVLPSMAFSVSLGAVVSSCGGGLYTLALTGLRDVVCGFAGADDFLPPALPPPWPPLPPSLLRPQAPITTSSRTPTVMAAITPLLTGEPLSAECRLDR